MPHQNTIRELEALLQAAGCSCVAYQNASDHVDTWWNVPGYGVLAFRHADGVNTVKAGGGWTSFQTYQDLLRILLTGVGIQFGALLSDLRFSV